MKKNDIIAFTGHRDILPDTIPLIEGQLIKLLYDKKPKQCISGVAIGFDTLAAEICIDLGIPFVAAVPFQGQENQWQESDKQRYYNLLKRAYEVKFICEPGFANYKYHRRDEWMVNNANLIISYYAHTKQGGTYYTLEYAKMHKKDIINIYDIMEK